MLPPSIMPFAISTKRSTSKFNCYWDFNQFLISVLIIAVLYTLALNSYLPCLKRVKSITALGGIFTKARMDIVICNALTGRWPDDTAQSIKIGWSTNYTTNDDPYVRKALIKNGAINVNFTEKMSNRVMTLRPAVPDNDLTGPIRWILTSDKDNSGWVVYGKDETSLESGYLPKNW